MKAAWTRLTIAVVAIARSGKCFSAISDDSSLVRPRGKGSIDALRKLHWLWTLTASNKAKIHRTQFWDMRGSSSPLSLLQCMSLELARHTYRARAEDICSRRAFRILMWWTAPTLRHRGAIGWLGRNATTLRGAVHGRGYHDRVDIAKLVFQIHGVDADGTVVIRRRVGRAESLTYAIACVGSA